LKAIAPLPLLALAAFLLFAPPADAALTRGPYLQNASPNAITIRWRTDTATSSRAWVGAVPGGTFVVASSAALTTEHELRLTGLVPETTYYYAVGSAAGRLPGADASWHFVTPPTAGAAVGRTRIWVLGDSGTPSAGQARVRDAYFAWTGERRTDVWLMLGDNAYESGTDSEFQAGLFDPYASFLRGHSLWSTRGNHDDPHSGVANDYYELFTLPTAGEAGGVPSATEAWYSFDHGDIHFICLDSQESSRDPGSPMLTWLAADLAATQRTWVIAFWHNAPYSKGSHDSDDDTRGTEMRENVMPILEQYGVDLVLSGHSHSYERTYLIDGHYGFSSTLQSSMILDSGDGSVAGDGDYRKPGGSPGAHQGTVAIVAGGSSTLEAGDLDHPAMARSLAALGSLVIDVNGSLLEAVYLDDLGAVRDRFAIRKGTVVDTGASAAAALRLRARSPVGRGPVDFSYALPGPGPATLTLLDATGRRVRVLALGPFAEAGPQSVRWDGNDASGHPVAAGVYFARLEFGEERRTARVVVVP
jgi:acid phosphatase type 7